MVSSGFRVLSVLLLLVVALTTAADEAKPWYRVPVADQIDQHRRDATLRHRLPFGFTSTAPAAQWTPDAGVVSPPHLSFFVRVDQWFPSADTALLILFGKQRKELLPQSATLSRGSHQPSWGPDLQHRLCDARCLLNATLRTSVEIAAAQRVLWDAIAALEDHVSGTFKKSPKRAATIVSVEWVHSTVMAYSAGFRLRPTFYATRVQRSGEEASESQPVPIGVLRASRFAILRSGGVGAGVVEDVEVRQFVQQSTGVRSTMSIIVTPRRRFLPPMSSESSPSSSATTLLRFMSYNVWNYNGDWARRCAAIAKTVKDESPAVALFQEVRLDTGQYRGIKVPIGDERTAVDTAGHTTIHDVKGYRMHSANQAEHLMRHIRTKLPYWFDFHPAMTYVAERSFQCEGPMIAHKFATLGSFPVFLQRPPPGEREKGDDHQRLVLCHALAVPLVVAGGGTATVRVDACSVHFSHTPLAQFANGLDTAITISELAQRPVGGLTAEHTVLVGDLNAEPDHDVVKLLTRGNVTLGVEGFRDAYTYVQSQRYPHDSPTADPCHKRSRQSAEDDESLGGQGFTFNNLDEKLVKRIDFVLSRSWAAGGASAPRTALCPVRMYHRGRKMKGRRDAPSDHVAVFVDFELRQL